MFLTAENNVLIGAQSNMLTQVDVESTVEYLLLYPWTKVKDA